MNGILYLGDLLLVLEYIVSTMLDKAMRRGLGDVLFLKEDYIHKDLCSSVIC